MAGHTRDFDNDRRLIKRDGACRRDINQHTEWDKEERKQEQEQYIKMNNKEDKWLSKVIKENVMKLMNLDEDDN